MKKIKTLPESIINKIRSSPEKSGLAYAKYGKFPNILDYTFEEIAEMHFGIYRDKKILLSDGNGFINLKEVVEAICILDKVTYFKKPTQSDYETGNHNSIKNIRTFYVKDYVLVTESKTEGITHHKITRWLNDIGAIKKGRHEYSGLFSNKNSFMTLQRFNDILYPKELYHPIKKCVNELFFNHSGKVRNFRVESKIDIHL